LQCYDLHLWHNVVRAFRALERRFFFKSSVITVSQNALMAKYVGGETGAHILVPAEIKQLATPRLAAAGRDAENAVIVKRSAKEAR
jgi:hypothetical protein